MSIAENDLSPSAIAYTRIKEAILNLTYGPGQRLSEAILVDELKLGRSPIRTALARLEGEGWIRIQPQSGTFVRALSAREVAELAELRLVLEAHAAYRAAGQIPLGDLAELREAFEALSAKDVKGHFQDFLALDDRFHTTIHRAAGNRRIQEILRTLRDQIHWVRVTTAVLPGRVDRSLREMRQVLDALGEGDGGAAADAMRVHIGNISDSFSAVLADHIETGE
jgi:DNA-binding GntR family transcriptional regulator